MSNAAMAWAFAQDLPSSEKFVLVSVADWAADREVFASIPAIARKTGLNEKTARRCIQRLVASGHLQPTGEKRGKTMQVIVYEITFSEDLFNAVLPAAKPPKSGSLPKLGGFVEAGGKSSQKRQALRGKGSQNWEGKDSQNWEGEDSQNWEADTKGDTKQEYHHNCARGDFSENADPADGIGLTTDDADDADDASTANAAADPSADPLVVIELTRRCMAASGIYGAPLPDGRPGRREQQARRIVAGWMDAGADPGLIMDMVERGREQAVDGINSLAYFDVAIRRELAKRLASDALDGAPADRAKTGATVEIADDGDDDARAIKLRLRERMASRFGSDATWAAWVAPSRFAVEADDLVITAGGAVRADWLRNNLASDFAAVVGDRAVRVVA